MITIIGLIGYSGRMGRAIAQVIETHAGAALGGGLIRKDIKIEPYAKTPPILTEDPCELFPHCDVLIDFSHPTVTPVFARLAADHKKPFLSGTTGLNNEAVNILRQVAQNVPVLHASNTSLSLVVAKHAARLAAILLQNHDYDISILDKHHKWKMDSPSGTARTLGEAILEGNNGKHEPTYTSIRAGSIIGEHEITFAGTGETLTIQHSVTDRRIFAQGAVQAAIWLAHQTPGYYSMDDVLGLSDIAV